MPVNPQRTRELYDRLVEVGSIDSTTSPYDGFHEYLNSGGSQDLFNRLLEKNRIPKETSFESFNSYLNQQDSAPESQEAVEERIDQIDQTPPDTTDYSKITPLSSEVDKAKYQAHKKDQRNKELLSLENRELEDMTQEDILKSIDPTGYSSQTETLDVVSKPSKFNIWWKAAKNFMSKRLNMTIAAPHEVLKDYGESVGDAMAAPDVAQNTIKLNRLSTYSNLLEKKIDVLEESIDLPKEDLINLKDIITSSDPTQLEDEQKEYFADLVEKVSATEEGRRYITLLSKERETINAAKQLRIDHKQAYLTEELHNKNTRDFEKGVDGTLYPAIRILQAIAETPAALARDLIATGESIIAGITDDEDLTRSMMLDAYDGSNGNIGRRTSRELRPFSEKLSTINFEGRTYEVGFDDNGNMTNIYDKSGNRAWDIESSQERLQEFVKALNLQNPHHETEAKTNWQSALNQGMNAATVVLGTMALGGATGAAARTLGAGTKIGNFVARSPRLLEMIPTMAQFSGTYAQDAIRSGKLTDPDEILAYGITGAIAEMLTEMINPMIGKIAAGRPIFNVKDFKTLAGLSAATQFKKIAQMGLEFGKNIGSEILEEFIMEGATPLINNAFNKYGSSSFENEPITLNSLYEVALSTAFATAIPAGISLKHNQSDTFKEALVKGLKNKAYVDDIVNDQLKRAQDSGDTDLVNQITTFQKVFESTSSRFEKYKNVPEWVGESLADKIFESEKESAKPETEARDKRVADLDYDINEIDNALRYRIFMRDPISKVISENEDYKILEEYFPEVRHSVNLKEMAGRSFADTQTNTVNVNAYRNHTLMEIATLAKKEEKAKTTPNEEKLAKLDQVIEKIEKETGLVNLEKVRSQGVVFDSEISRIVDTKLGEISIDTMRQEDADVLFKGLEEDVKLYQRREEFNLLKEDEKVRRAKIVLGKKREEVRKQIYAREREHLKKIKQQHAEISKKFKSKDKIKYQDEEYEFKGLDGENVILSSAKGDRKVPIWNFDAEITQTDAIEPEINPGDYNEVAMLLHFRMRNPKLTFKAAKLALIKQYANFTKRFMQDPNDPEILKLLSKASKGGQLSRDETDKQLQLENKVKELEAQRDALRSEDGSIPDDKRKEFSRLGAEILAAKNKATRGNSTSPILIKNPAINPIVSNPENLSSEERAEAIDVIEQIIQKSKSAEDALRRIQNNYVFHYADVQHLNKYLEDRFDSDIPRIGNNKDSFGSWVNGKQDSEFASPSVETYSSDDIKADDRQADKLAFRNREAEIDIEDSGETIIRKYREVTEELIEKSRPLLDPDNLKAGTGIKVEVLPDFDGVTYDPTKIGNEEVKWSDLKEKLSKGPVKGFGDIEYTLNDLIPIRVIGTEAYIPTVHHVALLTDDPAQIDEIRETRRRILEGEKDLIVTERTLGAQFKAQGQMSLSLFPFVKLEARKLSEEEGGYSVMHMIGEEEDIRLNRGKLSEEEIDSLLSVFSIFFDLKDSGYYSESFKKHASSNGYDLTNFDSANDYVSALIPLFTGGPNGSNFLEVLKENVNARKGNFAIEFDRGTGTYSDQFVISTAISYGQDPSDPANINIGDKATVIFNKVTGKKEYHVSRFEPGKDKPFSSRPKGIEMTDTDEKNFLNRVKLVLSQSHYSTLRDQDKIKGKVRIPSKSGGFLFEGTADEFLRSKLTTNIIPINVGTQDSPRSVFRIQPGIRFGFAKKETTPSEPVPEEKKVAPKTTLKPPRTINTRGLGNGNVVGDEVDLLPIEKLNNPIPDFTIPGMSENTLNNVARGFAYWVNKAILDLSEARNEDGSPIEYELDDVINDRIRTFFASEEVQTDIEESKEWVESENVEEEAKVNPRRWLKTIDLLQTHSEVLKNRIGYIFSKGYSFASEEELDTDKLFNDTADDRALVYDIKKSASEALQLYLYFIPKGTVILNHLDEFYSIDNIWHRVKNILAINENQYIQPNWEAYKGRLLSDPNHFDFIKPLVDKLDEAPEHIRFEFVTIMRQMQPKMYLTKLKHSSTVSGDSVQVDFINIADLNNAATTLNEWRAQFAMNEDIFGSVRDRDDETEGLVITKGVLDPVLEHIAGARSAFNTLNKIRSKRAEGDEKEVLNTLIEKTKAAFDFVGITLSKATYEQIKKFAGTDEGPELFSKFFDSKGLFGIFSTDMKRLSNKASNPEVELRTLSARDLFTDNFYTNLAKHDNSLSGKPFSDSNLSGNKIIQSSQLVRNYGERFYRLVNSLKGDNTYADGFRNRVYSKFAYWLRFTGDRNNKMSLEQPPLEIMRDDKTNDTDMANLGIVDRDIYKLLIFKRRTESMRNPNSRAFVSSTMESKKNSLVLIAPGFKISKDENGVKQVTSEGFTMPLNEFLFQQLVLPEILRMINHVPLNSATYNPNLFYNIPELNGKYSLDQWRGMLDYDSLAENEGRSYSFNPVDSTMWQEVLSVVEKHADKVTEDQIKSWEKKHLYDPEHLDPRISGVNYFPISKWENPKEEDLAKRIPYTPEQLLDLKKKYTEEYALNYLVFHANESMLILGDPAMYYKKPKKNDNAINSTFKNRLKRLAQFNASLIPQIQEKENEVYLQGMLNREEEVSSIIDEIVMILDNKKYDPTKGREEYPNSTKWFEVDGSDGQEFASAQFYLDFIRKLGGRITKKDYDRYSRMFKKQSWYVDRGKKIPEKYMLSPKELAFFLNPLKTLHSGFETENNVEYNILLKSSVFPLIPQVTRGFKIDAVRKAMETGVNGTPVGKVAYDTAWKLGAPLKGADHKNPIFDVTNTKFLSNSGLGLQQETPVKVKNKVPHGTQQTKLKFADLLESKFKYRGEEITGKQLKEKHDEIYSKLFELHYNKFRDEHTTTRVVNGKQHRILNYEKLRETIIKEMIARDYSMLDQYSVQLNEDKTGFKYPLWTLPSFNRIDALLSSIIEDRVLKQKFNGRSHILVSSQLFTPIEETDDAINVSKLGITVTSGFSGSLKSRRKANGDLLFAQVMVPWKFKEDINLFMKDGMIDPQKLPRRLLKGLGFRIPTSGLNSLQAIEVVGFLPPAMGDTILAPSDFTKQMGSDFDVDKLYTHLRNVRIIGDQFYDVLELDQPRIDETNYSNFSIEKSKASAEESLKIQFQKLTAEEKAKTIEQVTREHRSITALKDLAAKLAHRIGGKVEFQNHPNADWKGYNQGMLSVLNEAYMTPDTPFHEILAHPIIRAIKNKAGKDGEFNWDGPRGSTNSELYNNLIKELETGRGKEVFEQVKRDYVNKEFNKEEITKLKQELIDFENDLILWKDNSTYLQRTKEKIRENNERIKFLQKNDGKYTLEEQQEEAIVTLLGMMAADKLDAKKDATLISKLKELWKQISDFVKSLLRQDGIIIDELPITTTLNDLAEIMAYGNNKIILPGYKVEYSTPLGNKYDTLEEVNQEIRGLADVDVEVDLSNTTIVKEHLTSEEEVELNNLEQIKNSTGFNLKEERKRYKELYYKKYGNIKDFLEKNKEYEQSKEIIEQWKKENNIQYDPEEVYSRGQGFYSSIGAYSNLELDLLLKNLIQHIEDNKKVGGEFTISAFTKPIDKRLKHIEGTGDRVRFVIYPKSNHIKWAAPTDVYSGSVWDAHEKVSKDKKSELLGVSFTKTPALRNINEVSPNLANIIDNLSHAHNELGIELTTDNFRIEYDDNIDYSTKKLIDNINKILDDKYGKLKKPDLSKKILKSENLYEVRWKHNGNVIIRTTDLQKAKDTVDENSELIEVNPIQQIGKQPTQTKENTTSIESVGDKIDDGTFGIKSLTARLKYEQNKIKILQANIDTNLNVEESKKAIEETKKEISRLEGLIKNPPQKEYTSQALTNLKIAALKEVARKYPRSLITSKVVPINPNLVGSSEIQYSKVGSQEVKPGVEELFNENETLANAIYESSLIPSYPNHPVTKIISGGQTGVDVAGLDAALELGISTGGTAAANFTQSSEENNKFSNPELATKYGLKEGKVTKREGKYGLYDDVYYQRTIDNAQEADGTIWFGNSDSPGGKLTLGDMAQKGKPKPLLNPKNKEEILEWLNDNNIKTLNIAGNREHTNPGIYDKAKSMLIEALSKTEIASQPQRKYTSEEFILEIDRLQNEIMDINEALFESTDPIVEKKIYQPLGYGILEDEANERPDKGVTSYLSTETQGEYYSDARGAKGGVGSFSLDLVFNSIIQGTRLEYQAPSNEEYDLVLYDMWSEKLSDGTNRFKTIRSYEDKNGQTRWVIRLDDPYVRDKSKFKSDVLSAFQNVSVDDGNLQIMKKLGITPESFSVIRTMIYLGYKESEILATLKSHARFFEEVSLRSNQFAKQGALKIYGNVFNTMIEEFQAKASTQEEKDNLSRIKFFNEMGDNIRNLQTDLNLDAKGFSASMINLVEKQDAYVNMINKKAYKGFFNVRRVLLNGDKNTYVGAAMKYGTGAGELFFNYDLIPYGLNTVKEVMKEVYENVDQKFRNNTATAVDTKETIFSALKTFALEGVIKHVFGESLNDVRYQLTKGGKSAEDSAKYPVITLKLKRAKKAAPNNYFLSMLKPERLKDGKEYVYLIKTLNTKAAVFDDMSIVTSALELYNNPVQIEEGYSTRDFLIDLYKYSYAINPIQGPNEFMKYLHPAFMFAMPKYREYVRKALWNVSETPLNVNNFTLQFFQNYPEYSQLISTKEFKEFFTVEKVNFQGQDVPTLKIKDGVSFQSTAMFLRVRGAAYGFNSSFSLYMWDQRIERYVKVPEVGNYLYKKYNPDAQLIDSSWVDSNVLVEKIEPTERNNLDFVSFLSNIASKNPLAKVYKELLDRLGITISEFSVDPTIDAEGKHRKVSSKKSKIVLKALDEYSLIHELGHAVHGRLIDAFLYRKGEYNNERLLKRTDFDQDAADYIKELAQTLTPQQLETLENIEEIRAKYAKAVKTDSTKYRHGLDNLHEFFNFVIQDEGFRSLLDEQEKGVVQQIIDFISKVFADFIGVPSQRLRDEMLKVIDSHVDNIRIIDDIRDRDFKSLVDTAEFNGAGFNPSVEFFDDPNDFDVPTGTPTGPAVDLLPLEETSTERANFELDNQFNDPDEVDQYYNDCK